jgi:nucleoside-diphosphate-sugar epimerase
MSSILVTGGAGYVGSHTYKALRSAGFDPIYSYSISPSLGNQRRRIRSCGLRRSNVSRCVYDPTGLTPESGFLAAQAVKREIWQIGEPQKAAGELDRRGIRVRLGIVPA